MERATRTNWIIAVVSIVSVILLVLLMTWLRPGVLKEVTILAGVEGSRARLWAERYADYVRAHGVKAIVVTTAGSGEILERFQTKQSATVGFLQSGVERELDDGEAPDGLESLGSLYFEPVWLFVRDDAGIDDIPDLKGKRVYWGDVGGDAWAAARTLLRAYGVEGSPPNPALDQLGPSEAADALLAGEVDAVFLAGAIAGTPVRRLLAEDGVHPMSAQHANVFTRIHPDIGSLVIPKGLFGLAQMIPREDVRVIAPAINLVADEALHPALVDLFLDAATSLHRNATLLSKRGEFPSEDYTSLPMNAEAVRYYKQGPSGLRKYLPFWLASLVEQLIIYGLPVFVVLSTVFKGIPVYLEWKLKLDFLKFYKRLKVIENASDRQERREHYFTELDRIEAESARVRVPGVHLPHYFELHQYIHDMRERMERGW